MVSEPARARVAAVLALLLIVLAAVQLAVDIPDLLAVLGCLFVTTYCVSRRDLERLVRIAAGR
jgi:hypothetical protein